MDLIRTGECQRCGKCCGQHVIRLYPDDDFQTNQAKDYLDWLSVHKGVRVVQGKDYVEVIFDAPCKYLVFDDEGKSFCKIYETRFQICKSFPYEPVEHCKGYKFIDSEKIPH